MMDELVFNTKPVCFQTKKYGVISIAKNENAYCTPRDNKGPYTEVEIGLWSKEPDYLKEYADGGGDYEEGQLRVFAYVPVAILGRLLMEE